MARINDEFGILTENQRKRQTYARFIDRKPEYYLPDPVRSPRAVTEREIDRRVKEEVEAIIQKRVQERVAEIERLRLPTGVPVGEILVLVSDVTGCPVPDLVGPRRARNCAWPRFLAVHLLVIMRPDLSLPAIGHALGGRDHTTVMHSRNQVLKLLDTEPFTRWLADERVVNLLAQRPQYRRNAFGQMVAEAA